MNRRNLLRGAAAFTISAPAAIGIVAYDPILTKIAEYKAGLEDADKRYVSGMNIEQEDAICAATYQPHMKDLLEWNEPARTRDGAIAALNLMKDEGVFDDEMGEPLRLAVLGYLESLPA